MTPSPPLSHATVFVDGAPERRHMLHVYNPDDSASELALVLRDSQGLVTAEWQRTVPPGALLDIEIEADIASILDPAPESAAAQNLESEIDSPINSPGTAMAPREATVTIDADRPVALTALRITTNGRGEDMLAPAPIARGPEPAERTVLPWFVSGGEQQSSVVLVNPTDTVMTGQLAFHDASGARTALGTDSDVIDYRVPPYGSRVVASHDAGPRANRGYVVVTPAAGATPHSSALIERSNGGVTVSESIVTGATAGEALFAVDLRPTLIRHGEIDTQLVVVNPSAEVAALAVSSGTQTVATRELAPGEQAVLSVRALAGASANGVFSVSGDDALVVAARQQTTNIRAEQVDVELPPLGNAKFAPYVPNGAGIATEIRLANTASEPTAGTLLFLEPDGAPASRTILR